MTIVILRYVNDFTTDMAEFGITQRYLNQTLPRLNCDRDVVEADNSPVLFELVIPAVLYALFVVMMLSVFKLAYKVVCLKS